ncbi:MAG: biotin/lipoyl-binding carrier protein [Acidimicrobiales bacterium]
MTEVRAEMTASVWKVNVEVGQEVAAEEELIILESMKMEIPVVAPVAGTISAVHVAPEDQVAEGAVLVTLT